MSQEDERKRTTDEASKAKGRHQNQAPIVGLGAVKAIPAYGLDDDRRKGGVSLAQALVRNVGTCRRDGKGKVQGEDPQDRQYRGTAQGRINP